MPTQHTHLQAAQADTQAKVCKRVCLPHPIRNLIFFFPPFGVLIFFHPHPTRQDSEIQIGQGLQQLDRQNASWNIRLESCGVKWF